MRNNIRNINESTFKEWFVNWFDADDITEIAQIGPHYFPPFIRHADTSILYQKFGVEIWNLVREAAETYGTTVWALLDNLTQKHEQINTQKDFEYWMVWVTAEHLASQHSSEGLGDENNNGEQEEGA